MSDLSERIVRTVIGPDAEGVRVDQYLAQRFDYLSRHQWQNLIKDGKITINDAPAKKFPETANR